MQRIILSALVVSVSVLSVQAQPLSGGPVPYPAEETRAVSAYPPLADEREPMPEAQPVQYREPAQQYAARRGPNLGGGFIEFLFGGGQQRPEPRVTAVPPDAEPTPEGPGAIERLYEPRREAALPVARRMPAMDEKFLPAEVDYSGNEPPGTVVINTRERFLYLVMPNGKAQRYGIGVGRPGFTWAGVHKVTAKREWPDWTPPAEMRKRQPYLPAHMAGGPNNPLGARALYLGSTLYRIHGSNEPWTIGRAVSSGCIRMRNQDVIDLYGRVGVGAKVVVI
jgi:lipoprotein-anchoring transpeptidase ErfK/SrfK